jgi:hypothetical protein
MRQMHLRGLVVVHLKLGTKLGKNFDYSLDARRWKHLSQVRLLAKQVLTDWFTRSIVFSVDSGVFFALAMRRCRKVCQKCEPSRLK